ncbi:hypothetical protein sS8_3304 [Methylocaldum marinum]|uniref:Uncharacterized protein n=1 Tax=Methylocaldum marinum TaxID=1432792 RepID=A0A250KU86_9GAMM|nr:hypothetical protein sS8_3304 [Methylocaldum marinum]
MQISVKTGLHSLQIPPEHGWKQLYHLGNRTSDHAALLITRITKHVWNNGVAITGMTNTDAYPAKTGRSQFVYQVSQAVMPPVPTTAFQPRHTRRKVQLIMRHQDLLDRDLIIPSESCDRFSTSIHERHGLKEKNTFLFPPQSPDQPLEAPILPKHNPT